jgi:hypothetical protein
MSSSDRHNNDKENNNINSNTNNILPSISSTTSPQTSLKNNGSPSMSVLDPIDMDRSSDDTQITSATTHTDTTTAHYYNDTPTDGDEEVHDDGIIDGDDNDDNDEKGDTVATLDDDHHNDASSSSDSSYGVTPRKKGRPYVHVATPFPHGSNPSSTREMVSQQKKTTKATKKGVITLEFSDKTLVIHAPHPFGIKSPYHTISLFPLKMSCDKDMYLCT